MLGTRIQILWLQGIWNPTLSWLEPVLPVLIPHLSCGTPCQLLFPFPQNQSPTKNEYLSDLRIFKRICHRLWRQLKKKNSGNVWGNSNINRIIKGLYLSQGHYFEERKIHLHCKSDFFFNLAAATAVIPLLTVDANQCGVNAWHWEGPRSGCGACIINDTESFQRAHSMQGSQGGCKLFQILTSTKGDLLRYFAQKMRNLLIKHWTPWVGGEETLFSQQDWIQQLQKARAHKREHWGKGGGDQHGVRHSPMPPALFLNLLTLNSKSNHNNWDKKQKAPPSLWTRISLSTVSWSYKAFHFVCNTHCKIFNKPQTC